MNKEELKNIAISLQSTINGLPRTIVSRIPHGGMMNAISSIIKGIDDLEIESKIVEENKPTKKKKSSKKKSTTIED